MGSTYACWECGHTDDLVSGEPFPVCAVCHAEQWTGAVTSVHEALRLVARTE